MKMIGKEINGVKFDRNNTPRALFPVCTRVTTGDNWSVPEFFYNVEEAKKYAEKAPFADRKEETRAFNTVRAEYFKKRAEKDIEIGQIMMAEDAALKMKMYEEAAKEGRVVFHEELWDVDLMQKDKKKEMAAGILDELKKGMEQAV